MYIDKKELIILALQKALNIRKIYKYDYYEPICIYDLVHKINIETRFCSISNMEGIYSKKPSVILINSERPLGRQRFTCAHELAHHIFDHGTKVDELIIEIKFKKIFIPEEFIADCFAGFLLMPPLAIQKAFNIRNWDKKKSTPLQIYTLAMNFGVGYTTLITHLFKSLKMIDSSTFNILNKITPKNIKKELIGKEIYNELIIVDDFWEGRPIDIQIGDFIICSSLINCEHKNLKLINTINDKKIYEGISSGITRIFNDKTGWISFVRISKKNYIGLVDYMHLKEESND